VTDNGNLDPRIAAVPDIHGHAKGEHKPYAEERPIPYTARMLFLWFFHACRRSSPRFVMVADHMNYLTFEDPAAVNLVRRALKLAQAGDLYGAAETAGVELGHAAVVSEGLRRGMRYSIGAEIDNDPRCRPDAQNIVDAMKPDGMIRSVHFLPITHPQHGENWMWAFDNPEFKDLYDVVGSDNVWEIYMTTLLEAIEKLPGHIVGHFYVPAKFGHWPALDVLETYEDRFVAACAERGMAIEVNSRYFYKHYTQDDALFQTYRDAHLRLLRKAKAANVMIAVGSDAHSPKDQGGAFDTVLALLDEAEINEIAFPIAGRLARVALRATEEILREHTAALAAPVPAARHAVAAASSSDDPDADADSDEDDDDAEVASDVAPLPADGAISAPAPVAAASEADDAKPPAPKAPAPKRPAKKATPVAAVVGAAHSVAETVVAIAEKAVDTVAAVLARSDSPATDASTPAPKKATKPKVAASAAAGALASGALATVLATRAARSHDHSPAATPAALEPHQPEAASPKAASPKAASPKAARPKAAPTKAGLPEEAAPKAARPTAPKAGKSSPIAASTKALAKAVASVKAVAEKTATAAAKPLEKAKSAVTPPKPASKRAAAAAPPKGKAKAKTAPATVAKAKSPAKPTKGKATPARGKAKVSAKAAAKKAPAKAARPSAPAKKTGAKTPARTAAKSAASAKKATRPASRPLAKSAAKKSSAKKSGAKSKTSRARR